MEDDRDDRKCFGRDQVTLEDLERGRSLRKKRLNEMNTIYFSKLFIDPVWLMIYLIYLRSQILDRYYLGWFKSHSTWVLLSKGWPVKFNQRHRNNKIYLHVLINALSEWAYYLVWIIVINAYSVCYSSDKCVKGGAFPSEIFPNHCIWL